MTIYAIGVFLTLALYLVVGNYAGSKVKNVEDYYVSGRQAPTLLIVGTLVASYLSTNALMGETGFSYDGYPGLLLWLVGINACGYVLGALFFGRYIRRSNALTVPEFLGKRFDSRKVQMVAGITVVLGITAYLLAVTRGASILMSELLGLNEGLSMIIVWVVYTSFTFYGGSKGVIITDTIMFLLFTAVVFIATPFLVGTAGGWTTVVDKLANLEGLKAGILSWHSSVGPEGFWPTPTAGLIWALIMGIAWAGVVAVSPWQTSRYLMAKSEHVVMRSAFSAGAIIMLIYFPMCIIGVTIVLINPDLVNEKAFIWTAFNVLPTWLGITVLAGILASALSSASTFLSLVGFSVVRDILPERIEQDEKQKLMFSRYVMLACGLVALVVCYFQPPAIIWMTYFAATVFAASWGPVCILSIWNSKITADGASWSIIMGFSANSISKLGSVYLGWSLPVWADPFIIGLVFSTVTIFLVSSFTKVTEPALEYQKALFVAPVEEYTSTKEINTTMWYSKIYIALGILGVLLMIFYYALPYARAFTG